MKRGIPQGGAWRAGILLSLLLVSPCLVLAANERCLNDIGECTRFVSVEGGSVADSCGHTSSTACSWPDVGLGASVIPLGAVICFLPSTGPFRSPPTERASQRLPYGSTLCATAPNTLITGRGIDLTASLFVVDPPTTPAEASGPPTVVAGLQFSNLNFLNASLFSFESPTLFDTMPILKLAQVRAWAVTTAGPTVGALWASAVHVQLIDSHFSYHRSTAYGTFGPQDSVPGGSVVHISANGKLTTDNTTFEYNLAVNSGAEDDTGGFGGAVDVTGVLTLHRTTFIHNSARRGGAIHYNGFASIIDCSFENNTAVMVGGALRSAGANATVLGSLFRRNTAPLGSAIALGNYELLDNPNFSSSTDSDGAGATFRMAGTFFDHNVGNALLIRPYIAQIDNCTFVGNVIHPEDSGATRRYGQSIAALISAEFTLSNSTFVPSKNLSLINQPEDATGVPLEFELQALHVSLSFASLGSIAADIQRCRFLPVNPAAQNIEYQTRSLALLADHSVGADRVGYEGNGTGQYSGSVHALHNWFGDKSGPKACCRPDGKGSAISIGIDFSAWCLDEACADFAAVSVAETCGALKCGYAPEWFYAVFGITAGGILVFATFLWVSRGRWVCLFSSDPTKRKEDNPVGDFSSAQSSMQRLDSTKEKLEAMESFERLKTKEKTPADFSQDEASSTIEIMTDQAEKFDKLHYSFKVLAAAGMLMSVIGGVFVVVARFVYICEETLCPEGRSLGNMMDLMATFYGVHVLYYWIFQFGASIRPTTSFLRWSLAVGLLPVLNFSVIQPSLMVAILAWDAKRGFADKPHATPVNFIAGFVMSAPAGLFALLALFTAWSMYQLLASPELLQLESQLSMTRSLIPKGTSLRRSATLDAMARPLKALLGIALALDVIFSGIALVIPIQHTSASTGLMAHSNIVGPILAMLPFIMGGCGVILLSFTIYYVIHYYRTAPLFVVAGLVLIAALITPGIALLHALVLSHYKLSEASLFGFAGETPIYVIIKAVALAVWVLLELCLVRLPSASPSSPQPS